MVDIIIKSMIGETILLLINHMNKMLDKLVFKMPMIIISHILLKLHHGSTHLLQLIIKRIYLKTLFNLKEHWLSIILFLYLKPIGWPMSLTKKIINHKILIFKLNHLKLSTSERKVQYGCGFGLAFSH